MAGQNVSIGVKISDDLIKSTLAVHIAKTLGNAEEVLGKVICAVLDKKKDSYSSSPTFLEQLMQDSIKPIAQAEWEIYLKEIEPDLRRLVRKHVTRKGEKEKLLKALDEALEKAFADLLYIQLSQGRY